MDDSSSYFALLDSYPQNRADIESKIASFREYLLEVNLHVNLVSRNKTEAAVNDLIYDSLAMIPLIDYAEGTLVLDIGSGAGFPWVIHKIVRPDLRITTVDSNQRKIEFQKNAARKLGFLECKFLSERVEKVLCIGCDYAIAKAFGSLDLIAELALPHLKPSGRLVLPRIGSEQSILELPGYSCESVRQYQSSSAGRVSNLLILKKS